MTVILQQIFNPLLEREMSEPLKLDRVHRIARYTIDRLESPRDVIEVSLRRRKIKNCGKTAEYSRNILKEQNYKSMQTCRQRLYQEGDF